MMSSVRGGVRVQGYEVLLEIDRGGMGSVWLARRVRDHGFEKLFAIKFTAPYLDDKQTREMFIDEMRIASRVDHPNVVEVYDVSQYLGQPFAVIQWIDGYSLKDILHVVRARNGSIPPSVLLHIAAELCAGLHAVHELRDRDGTYLDVVHRDVSPRNVLVSHHGQTKLIDFGIARSRDRLAALTGQGSLKGKLRFMAPEHAFGEAVDRRADIWSTGAVLFDAFTGSPPCAGSRDREVITSLAKYRQPPAMGGTIPGAAASVLWKALQRRPGDRFANAEQMQDALLAVLRSLGGGGMREVSAFFNHVMGDLMEVRREKIAIALRRADVRED